MLAFQFRGGAIYLEFQRAASNRGMKSHWRPGIMSLVACRLDECLGQLGWIWQAIDHAIVEC